MRNLAVLLAGAAASLAAWWLLPLSPGDPFRGTLAVLPFVLAGFHALAGEARLRGGRGLPRAAVAAELVALAALVAAAVGRRHLGLADADELLAAGFVLLLAHRAARQVLGLRPLLGRRVPERPSVLFLFLPLLVYVAVLPWQSFHRPPDGDEPYYLLITHSLADDLDADLTDEYAEGASLAFLDRRLEPQPGDPVGPRGQLYSRHNEALPLVLAPAYAVAGAPGALVVMAALTAAFAWWTLRLGRRYWPRRPGEVLVAWGLFALAPPLLLYSYQVWVEVPAALLSMIALDRILSQGRRRWGWRSILAVSVPVLLLPLLKIRFMLLAVPLVGLAWWHSGRPRKPLLVLALALALLGGGILVHNQLVFGNPLKIHGVEELELTGYPADAFVLGTLGLFYDSAFGLFACAPAWLLLLALPASPTARRRPEEGHGTRGLLFDLAAFSLPYLVIVVPRAEWYGGWSPPFRYALVALPLLALLLVPVLADRRRPAARALVAALALATLALTLLWLVVPGWTYNFADGRTYLLDHLSARLGGDTARLFPSSVRPRAATWLWPLATALLVPLLWALPAGRRRGRAQRAAGLTGAAALLLAAAAVPVVVHRLPTRVVELEDPHVTRSDGHLYPHRWVVDRTRFRGGWTLPEGDRVTVPLEPGGEEVRLRLHTRFVENVPHRPMTLTVRAGEEVLATVPVPEADGWSEIAAGPFRWPVDAPLVLEANERLPGQWNGVILDRVELEWR